MTRRLIRNAMGDGMSTLFTGPVAPSTAEENSRFKVRLDEPFHWKGGPDRQPTLSSELVIKHFLRKAMDAINPDPRNQPRGRMADRS